MEMQYLVSIYEMEQQPFKKLQMLKFDNRQCLEQHLTFIPISTVKYLSLAAL